MSSREPDQPMRYPQYVQLSKREATFEQGWPEPLQGKIPDIARAGFYYKGVNDNATCFHCGITLMNWDPEDDPSVEHAYWNPNCPYINQYKGRGWVMNVFIVALEQNREGPESTWIQGKWMTKAGDCIKDYAKNVVLRGYDIIDCACETHYCTRGDLSPYKKN
ncbi:baculoviral IAP repeat-containing protein 7-B-like [Saccostrea cucullata]|uniref:baculoviral IAP repeat-containing protein 7-B-like n=1 Tax=Saccostrea cuccullata TaxID=36930 RepID=UPI002ED1A19A